MPVTQWKPTGRGLPPTAHGSCCLRSCRANHVVKAAYDIASSALDTYAGSLERSRAAATRLLDEARHLERIAMRTDEPLARRELMASIDTLRHRLARLRADHATMATAAANELHALALSPIVGYRDYYSHDRFPAIVGLSTSWMADRADEFLRLLAARPAADLSVLWDALTDAERELLITQHPEIVAGLRGVPEDVRLRAALLHTEKVNDDFDAHTYNLRASVEVDMKLWHTSLEGVAKVVVAPDGTVAVDLYGKATAGIEREVGAKGSGVSFEAEGSGELHVLSTFTSLAAAMAYVDAINDRLGSGRPEKAFDLVRKPSAYGGATDGTKVVAALSIAGKAKLAESAGISASTAAALTASVSFRDGVETGKLELNAQGSVATKQPNGRTSSAAIDVTASVERSTANEWKATLVITADGAVGLAEAMVNQADASTLDVASQAGQRGEITIEVDLNDPDNRRLLDAVIANPTSSIALAALAQEATVVVTTAATTSHTASFDANVVKASVETSTSTTSTALHKAAGSTTFYPFCPTPVGTMTRCDVV